MQANHPLRIVVASAKDGLRAKLEKLGAPESVRLEILSEWDDGAKYMPSVDLTIGAADSLALVYGVPAILLCCKSPAEQAFARYCVDELKCAKLETDPQKAAELALQLLRTDTCAHMQAQARSVAAARGAETIADILFEQLTARFTTAPDGAVTRAYK